MASQGVTGTTSRLSQMQKFRAAMRRHVPLASNPSQDHLRPPLKLNESWASRRLVEALRHLPHSNTGVSLGISAPTGSNQPALEKGMRFQQKQLQDRVQRRVELTVNAASDASDGTTNGQKPAGNGKVRQMFDERRRGAGIDRSHPLKPITTMTTTSKNSKSNTALSTTAMRPAGVGGSVAAARRQPPVPVRRQVTVRRTVVRSEGGIGSRDGNLNHADELAHLESEAFGEKFSSMSLNDNILDEAGDRNNNNSEGEYFMSREQSSNSIKLKPVITKKSPVTTAARSTAARQVAASAMGADSGTNSVSNVSGTANRNVRSSTVTSKKLVSAVVKTPPKKSTDKMSMHGVGMRQQTPMSGAMSACRYCSRHFNEDRLAKHEHICQKMMNTKRKVFDASKHRVKGTEAEQYLKKPPTSRSSRSAYTNTATMTNMNANSAHKSNNWRKKHEEFITAIRAAKQVQAHLARGGKLSDLPPPPPSENPDYIQCPHCMRRFNQAAAERHIPKCANMQHNKPKPGSAAGARRR